MTETCENEYTEYINLPEPVGWWIIGDGYYNGVYKKPNRFHRFITTLLLGWEWKDNDCRDL